MNTLPAPNDAPTEISQNKQYDLFASFLGDPAELSNSIELWDAIPKYHVSARRQVELRDTKGRLPVHEHRFEYNNEPCRIVIQPASIQDEDGNYKDWYPATNEQYIEEVLKKFFADASYGLHEPQEARSWVKFSISMIRRELAARKRQRSPQEIIKSLEILANTVIRVYVGDSKNPIHTEPILGQLTGVSRAEYLEDPSSLWVARLPFLVSKSINQVTYRQFDYGTFMALNQPLARWLHKRFSHRYINASLGNTYHLMLSTIKRDSGMLTHARINTNTNKLEEALDELVEANVLTAWDKQEQRGGRNKILDIKYVFYPSMPFVSMVKAANRRKADALGTDKKPRSLSSRR